MGRSRVCWTLVDGVIGKTQIAAAALETSSRGASSRGESSRGESGGSELSAVSGLSDVSRTVICRLPDLE